MLECEFFCHTPTGDVYPTSVCELEQDTWPVYKGLWEKWSQTWLFFTSSGAEAAALSDRVKKPELTSLRMRQYKELVSNPSWANQESQSCADSTRTQQKTLPVGSSKTANREAAVESQWVLRWIVLKQEPNIMDLSWWLKLHHFIMRKVKANLLKINISGNFLN